MSERILTLSDRESWLFARRHLIGASDSPSILGVGYRSEYEVWAEKIGTHTPEDLREQLEIGSLLQPAIAELARRRTGAAIVDEPNFVIRLHPRHDWLGASLDARIEWSTLGRGPGVVELKNVGPWNAGQWEEGPPLDFQVQVQHQLAVTGWRWGLLIGLIGGNRLRWHVIERNEPFIEVLLARLAEFWSRVERRESPEPDGSPGTARAIAALHPRDNGQAVELPEDAARWSAELEEVSAECTRLGKKKDELSNKIRAAMGPATYGRIGDQWYSLITQDRKGYTVEPSTCRVLRRLSQPPKGVEPVAAATKHKRWKSYADVRRRLLQQCDRCRWCNKQLTVSTATIDHVNPLALGGSNAEENLCLACEACNKTRGSSGLDPQFIER